MLQNKAENALVADREEWEGGREGGRQGGCGGPVRRMYVCIAIWEGVGVLTGVCTLVLNLGGCGGPVRSTYM